MRTATTTPDSAVLAATVQMAAGDQLSGPSHRRVDRGQNTDAGRRAAVRGKEDRQPAAARGITTRGEAVINAHTLDMVIQRPDGE